MTSLLPILLSEFHDKLKNLSRLHNRSHPLVSIENKVTVAIGMRRVGKTTCMLKKIYSLLNEEQVSLEQIFYINLEDDRLLPYSLDDLKKLIDEFYLLYPDNHDRCCYFFLDEIQNIPNWPILIRRLLDSKLVKLFLSGASAKLLSKEIHTSLRGRSFSQEIWPLSFVEFCQAQKIKLDGSLLSQKNMDRVFSFLRTYLEQGGFPEVLDIKPEYRRQILQDYVDVVVMRDVIERHNISNVSLIKYMIKTLLKNTAGSFAINKFHNDLKSQGITAAKNTLYDYLEYIQDAYLNFSVSLYSESARKSQSNPRKIYAVDPGLVRAYSFGINKNYGHYFENLIYLDLRRQGHKVYYYLTSERYEIDFFAIDNKGEPKLLQVAWDLTDQKTLDRELRALRCAEKELGLKGKLITPQQYINDVWRELKIL